MRHGFFAMWDRRKAILHGFRPTVFRVNGTRLRAKAIGDGFCSIFSREKPCCMAFSGSQDEGKPSTAAFVASGEHQKPSAMAFPRSEGVRLPRIMVRDRERRQHLSTKPERTPIIPAHHQLADEIIHDLDAIQAKIEKLEREFPEHEDVIRAHVNVPVVFMSSTVALVEETPDLEGTKRLDPVEGHDTLQFLNAFGTVHDRMIALARRLKLNLKSRKARLAGQSLQIYGIAKGLIRDGKHPELAARVEILGHYLGPRGRPRKSRKA